MQESLPEDVKIEVRRRSAFKAARNDPRRTPTPEYYIRQMNRSSVAGTSGDSSEDLSLASDWSGASEDDIFAGFEDLGQLDGRIIKQEPIYSGDRQVGYCYGKVINRYHIRSYFRHAMMMQTGHARSLALDLLDRYGRLKQEFKNHPVKKGSGVWRAGLDGDDIFLIENLEIDRQYRRCGFGSRLVRAMLETVESGTLYYTAIVRPSALNENELQCESAAGTTTTELTSEDISKSFWRSLGFRRIGSSSWFGFASDAKHPSRHLTRADDYELPEVPLGRLDLRLQNDLIKALTSGDIDYAEVLSRLFDDVAKDDPRWKLTDADGNTVLHFAATKIRPISVQWILSQTTELLQQRNNDGETPLDALLAKLENIRTTDYYNLEAEDVSDYFSGFSDTAVSCLMSLNGRNEATDDEWQRLKYGCTCGRCISGFLSPQMRSALEYQAEILSDQLLEDISNGELWVANNNSCLYLFSHRLRNKLKASQRMRKGLVTLLGHIAACLQGNMIPSEHNVEMILRGARSSSSERFLQRGGSVEAVATMLFRWAMESDELAGNPSHLRLEAFEAKICQVPACRNDHEFGFVSGMCGYERLSPIKY
jgi:ribosomal protein S18 acetylase RimI-like enzyme